jgi:hypothetical protein
LSDTRRELAIRIPRLADPRRRDELARMARVIDLAAPEQREQVLAQLDSRRTKG